MSDTTPDPPEGETTASQPVRRAGLDRLRAARGASAGGSTSSRGGATPPSDPGDGGASPTGAAAGAEPSRGGTTTLLETPTSPELEPTPADEATAASGAAHGRGRPASAGPDGQPPRRRLGRLTRGGTAAPGRSAPSERAEQRHQLLALGLLVLVVALLIPVIAMRHRIIGQSKEQKAVTDLVDKRTEALAEARRFAVTFFSPDYKTIDQYSDQVAAQSTGQFNQDFASKRGELKSLLTKVQSQASGRVLAAGVSKVSGNDVEVLVVADQDVKNTTSQGKTVTNRYRVRVSVQKTPKGWLVTDLEPVV